MGDDSKQLPADLIAELERQADALAKLPSGSTVVAQFEWLVNTLILRDQIPDSFRRLILKVRGIESTHTIVRLGVLVDKYQVIPAEGIDCGANLHLCGARCCSYKIPLTKQDVVEGKLPWDIEQPYLMSKDPVHKRCSLMDETGGCTAYEVRPSTCRTYDCRSDRRVWLDYDNRVPAPMVDVDGNPIPVMPAMVRAAST